jgi:hypothetical protein
VPLLRVRREEQFSKLEKGKQENKKKKHILRAREAKNKNPVLLNNENL